MIYLLHHAAAVDPGVDPQQPLSPAGRAHAERLAADASARGVRPGTVWHSGKLRARQTAEVMWRACNPLAEFGAIRGLQPTDAPGEVERRLAGEARDVMLVGHLPNLRRILLALVGGSEDEAPPAFPLHGLVTVAAEGDRWVEKWRMG